MANQSASSIPRPVLCAGVDQRQPITGAMNMDELRQQREEEARRLHDELTLLRRAKGLEPHDVTRYLGVPPGVDAPLSIVDYIVEFVRARSGTSVTDEFMGEVDGEELDGLAEIAVRAAQSCEAGAK